MGRLPSSIASLRLRLRADRFVAHGLESPHLMPLKVPSKGFIEGVDVGFLVIHPRSRSMIDSESLMPLSPSQIVCGRKGPSP